jgi:hypothetical protein
MYRLSKKLSSSINFELIYYPRQCSRLLLYIKHLIWCWLLRLYRNDDSSDMQPMGVICWFESKYLQNSDLLSNVFENVRFRQDESNSIYLWDEPVEILDQNGSTIKCFVLNWRWEDEDENIKNSLLAFWVLLSSWLNISNEQDLPRISNLINSLSEENCYESEQELIELLPSLTFTLDKVDDDNKRGKKHSL